MGVNGKSFVGVNVAWGIAVTDGCGTVAVKVGIRLGTGVVVSCALIGVEAVGAALQPASALTRMKSRKARKDFIKFAFPMFIRQESGNCLQQPVGHELYINEVMLKDDYNPTDKISPKVKNEYYKKQTTDEAPLQIADGLVLCPPFGEGLG